MEAFILSLCMVTFAGVLTRRHTKQKSLSKPITNKIVNSKKTDTATHEERPYYDRFISKHNNNNLIDYSGGIMGI